jgi:hypothetical protein
MASDKKVMANQNNAKASCGPRSSAGKRRSSRNAVRHGLAVDVESDPAWGDAIDVLTNIFCLERDGRYPELCREAARSATDLQRIRQAHARLLNKSRNLCAAEASYSDLNSALVKIDRYERRALSRRKRAFKLIDGG